MRLRPVIFIAIALVGCALIVFWFTPSNTSKQASVQSEEIAHLSHIGFTNVGLDESASNGNRETNAYRVYIGNSKNCRFAVAVTHGDVISYEFLQMTPYLSPAGVDYVNKLMNAQPSKPFEPTTLKAFGLPDNCY